ncbi:hypothetical protein C6P40_001341 [Pichia californica]|uniref:Transcription factor tau 91 kDa subunit n=1 Tax=Pichia californica TaxID=460514 RepID=A0A9P6WJC4_9ASCO|nr:hypothetical protein C6P40_001341 [[Candida] californica]
MAIKRLDTIDTERLTRARSSGIQRVEKVVKPKKQKKTDVKKTTEPKPKSKPKSKSKSKSNDNEDDNEDEIKINDETDIINDSIDFNSDEYPSAESIGKELNTIRSLNPPAPFELKFIQSFGFNSDILKKFYEIQYNHSESSFTPSKLKDFVLDNAVKNNTHGLFSIENYKNIKEPKLKKLTNLKDYFSNFYLKNRLEFQFNNLKSTILDTNHVVNFPLNQNNIRNGLVFNSGGLPLTMEWYPFQINGKKYLFMSLVDKTTNLNEFSNKKSLLTILEIESKNSNELKFNINRQILLDFVLKEIEFSYLLSEKETLLKLTLSNGELEIWKITPNFFKNDDNLDEPNIYLIDSNVLKLKIPHKEMKITTSKFATSNHIIIGTNHGFMGQFTIDSGKLNYLIDLKIPAITNILISIPSDPKNYTLMTLHVSSSDFSNHLISLPMPNEKSSLLNNVNVVECPSISKELIYNKNSFYMTYLNTFLTVENNVVIRSTSLENPSNSRKFRVGIDDDICCLSGQNNYENGHLNTGFMLFSGHINGTIRLYNYLNLLSMGDRKNPSSTLKFLQLNNSIINSDKYWLDLNYKVDKIGETKSSTPSSMRKTIGRCKDMKIINSNGICPLKISVLGNMVASCWGNGLVIIEDLIV